MPRLRVVLILLGWLAALALAGYELVQKSPGTPLGPLPGAQFAGRAEQAVPYRAVTGLPPLDLLLHESQEACLYYHTLTTGRLAPRRR